MRAAFVELFGLLGGSARVLGTLLAPLLLSGCGADSEGPTSKTELPAAQSAYGSWSVQSAPLDILAVHAALMPDGYVLAFGGSQYDHDYQLGNGTPGREFQYRGWVPQPPPTAGFVVPLVGPQEPWNDLFCSGHSFTADGKLLVVGGNQYYIGAAAAFGGIHFGHFTGTHAAWLFNGSTPQWTPLQNMSKGRWYPTVVNADFNGGMFVLEGHLDNSWQAPFPPPPTHAHDNTTVDWMANFSLGAWTNMTNSLVDTVDYYPRAHLISDGSVFIASPIPPAAALPANVFVDCLAGNNTCVNKRIVKFGASIVAVDAGPAPSNAPIVGDEKIWRGYEGTSVLMPYRLPQGGSETYTPDEVLLVNGNQPLKKVITGASPGWSNAGTRIDPPGAETVTNRVHGSATILPTGDIFVSGGVTRVPNSANLTNDVLTAEIYRRDAADNYFWELAAKPTVARGYHSVALLLPDGRVWTAGGSKFSKYSIEPGADNRELRVEIFTPWYFNHGSQPTISNVPAAVTYGTPFCVTTPQYQNVKKIALLKLGSVTHAFNSDQRYVELPVINTTSCPTGVQTRVPSAQLARAPKGYYYLYISTAITHAAGSFIPSKGIRVRLQ